MQSRILLVDENPSTAGELQKILGNEGYTAIASATDIRSAFDRMEAGLRADSSKAPFDLILADAAVDNQSGIAFLKQIRSHPVLSEIPVVLLMEPHQRELLEEAFASGMADYLMRPYLPAAVSARLKGLEELNRKQARERQLEAVNQTLVDDLNVAKQLQSKVLPAPMNTGNVSVQGMYMPYTYLGGDLYHWEKLDYDRVGVLLLDVMGHGTATALICMYIRSVLPELIQHSAGCEDMILSLNRFALDLNRLLSPKEIYFTAFYMIADTREKTLSYVNAGHPPMAFFEKNKPIRWLDKGSIPVGLMADIPMESETLSFETPSHAMLFSDGIYDLLKSNSLNIEYLMNYARLYGRSTPGGAPVLEKVFRLIEQLPRHDDVSLVHLEFPG